MVGKLTKYFLLMCGIVVGANAGNTLWAQQTPANAQREGVLERWLGIETNDGTGQRQHIREQRQDRDLNAPRQRYTGAPRAITRERNDGYYDAVDDDFEGVGYDYGRHPSYSGQWQPQRWYHTGYYGRSFGHWLYDSIDSEFEQFDR